MSPTSRQSRHHWLGLPLVCLGSLLTADAALAQGGFGRASNPSRVATSGFVDADQIAWVEDGTDLMTRRPYDAPARTVVTVATGGITSAAFVTRFADAEYTFTVGDEIRLVVDGQAAVTVGTLGQPRVFGHRYGIGIDPANGRMCGWRANRNVLETFGHVGLGQQIAAMHSIDGRDFVLLVSNGLASSVLLVNATSGQSSTLLAESMGVTVSDVRRFLSPGNFQQTAVNFLDANGRGQIGRLVQGGVVPMTSGDGDHRALGAWSVSDFGFGAGALFTLSDSQNGTGIHLGRTHRNGGNYEFLTTGNAMTLRGALLASPTSRGELVCMTAEMPPGSPSQVFRWHGSADVRVEPIDPTVAPGSRLEIEFFAAPGELGTVLLASDFATPITVAGFGGTLHLSLTPPPLVLSSGIGGNDPRVPLSFPFQLPNDPQLHGLRVALQSARVTATQRRFGRHSYLSVF